MIEGTQTVSGMAGSVLATMRAHAKAGWFWAVAWGACLASAIYLAAMDVPPFVPMVLSLCGFVLLVIWEVAVLRSMVGDASKYVVGVTEFRYAVSFVLYLVILCFGGVIILFPVILSTMALWAMVNFDMNAGDQTQEELAASFEAFQTHPLFALCVAVFAAGIAGLFALMMRGRAYAAASVTEQRIVAMEAFIWTRRYSLYLTGVGFLVLAPFLLIAIGAASIMSGLETIGSAARAAGCSLVAAAVWVVMLALQGLSAEVYRRFRSAPASN